VYLQASLHADELPGMLVLQHLRQRLQAAEVAGQIQGEVVLVPLANPIGLDQTWMQLQMGRFEMGSGQNFNRHYPVLATWLRESGHDVAEQLGPDAQRNAQTIRQAMHAALQRHPPTTELDSLRHTLMHLACDADVALDLHCDFEAAMHLYTEPPCADKLLPLAALLDLQ
jgi:predicted deacylase